MTDVTTIKVTRRVRDRLKAQAAAAQLSLGEHLAKLADQADRQARMASLKRAIEGTPRDLMDSYVAETLEWEAAELSDTDARR